MKCEKCNNLLIRASMYDPDGEVPLEGGIKEYHDNGGLKEWWICPVCNNGKVVRRQSDDKDWLIGKDTPYESEFKTEEEYINAQ